MNRALAVAFFGLRVTERTAVQQALDITFRQGHHESNIDFSTRLLQEIEKEGKMRELETAMMPYL